MPDHDRFRRPEDREAEVEVDSRAVTEEPAPAGGPASPGAAPAGGPATPGAAPREEMAEEPPSEEPAPEEPALEEQVPEQQPAPEEQASEEPVREEPVTPEEATSEEPGPVDESAPEEPVAEEPVAEEPVAEAPEPSVTAESVPSRPEAEQPTMIRSAVVPPAPEPVEEPSRPPVEEAAVGPAVQGEADGDAGDRGPDDATAQAPTAAEPAVRTLRDWLRPDLSQSVIAILLAVFAFAVVTQIRTRDEVDSYASLRQSDLVGILDGLNEESQRLQGELDTLQQARSELESGQDSEAAARAQAEERLTSLGILAGTVPAQGPGITLTITDPEAKVKANTILDAFQEMRDAGAEAMQVNGTIRIVANSWVSNGTSGIVIDGQRVSTPITLEVIGDPHSLEEAARFRGGLVSSITDPRVGGQVAIVRSDNLGIDSLHQVQAPQYARADGNAAAGPGN